MTGPDPILAALDALGGNITEARKTIAASLKGLRPSFWTATGNLALRALDDMERPAGDDAKLRKLIQRFYQEARDVLCGKRDSRNLGLAHAIAAAEEMLSETAPASDGRTGSCAECERLAKELEAAQATNKSLERYRTTVGNLRSVMQDDDHRAWVAMGRPENTRTTNAVLICEKFAELTEANATLTRERDEARQSSDTYERACTKALAERDVQRAHDALREAMKDKCMPAEKPAAPSLDSLLAKAKDAPPMTAEEREAQRQSWVRGNLAIDRDEDSRKTIPANPPASPDGSTADAELRIASWRDRMFSELRVVAGYFGSHRLAPLLDEQGTLMRSLAADNERLRVSLQAEERAHDFDVADLRAKLAEAETAKLGADSFRAKLREELARASQVEADLRTQLVVMENKLVRSLRGGGK